MTEVTLAQVATPGEEGLSALALTVIVALIYLLVVRFMDLNEKEPIWAIFLVSQQGFIVALILPLVVDASVLELDNVLGPIAKDVAMFIALTIGVAFLGVIGRSRGWLEMSGVMDGVVYGATVGLGFAAGGAFAREFRFAGSAVLDTSGTLSTIWATALAGLSLGLVGAIMGVGFGAASVRARTTMQQVAYPLGGLVAAILVHILYDVLREGGAVGGSLARTWVALALPLVFVIALVVVALSRERRAINEQLADERGTGAITEDDLSLLRSFGARRAKYAGAFFKGDFDGWLALRSLHSRQVQLALAKERAARESDPDRRAEVEAEVERLRAAALGMRPEVDRVWGKTTPRRG